MNLMARRRALMAARGGGGTQENFLRVGNPVIENGILKSTNTDGDYITTIADFDPQRTPWEIVFKLYRPSNYGFETVLQSAGITLQSPWNGNGFKLFLYGDDTTITGGQTQRECPSGESRWLKLCYSGSRYDYGVSADGSTYTYVSGNTTPFTGYDGIGNGTIPIKAGKIAFGKKTLAEIDLTETIIKVNGSVWWKPYI